MFLTKLDSFNDMFDKFFGKDMLSPYFGLELKDEEKEMLLRVELPGFDASNVLVEIQDNILSIKAKKKFEETKKRSFRSEVSSFYRSFSLDQNIDASNISAEVKNGVLLVTMPKKIPETKILPRKVEVKS